MRWQSKTIALMRSAMAKPQETGNAQSHDGGADDKDSDVVRAYLKDAAPYLYDLSLRHAALYADVFAQDMDCLPAISAGLIAEMETFAAAAHDEPTVMGYMRRQKQKLFLVLALAQIVDAMPLAKIMKLYSKAHDAFVALALGCARRALSDENEREAGGFCRGMAVLALGKLGGQELNFSSDIDILIIYDENKILHQGAHGPHRFATRVAQKMVYILQALTEEGFVCRVDLRLRPDPSATAICAPLASVLHYYETRGSYWERLALMKLRFVAGDGDVAHAFTKSVYPFIWRTYLDYRAFEELRALKAVMSKEHGRYIEKFGKQDFYDYNIKLGQGGIRDLEFFCQVLQLIFSARESALRLAPTLAALRALRRARHLDKDVCRRLYTAYLFLRKLENTLQFAHNRQTHTTPKTDALFERVRVLMGFLHLEDFKPCLREALETVSREFAALLSNSHDTGIDGTRPSGDGAFLDDMCGAILAANRHVDSKLLWGTFSAIRDIPAGAGAFENLSRLVAQSRAPNELLQIVHHNKMRSLEWLNALCAKSALFEELADHPHVLDLVICDGFDARHLQLNAMRSRCARHLARAETLEKKIDSLKIFNREEKFRIAFGAQTDAYALKDIGAYFSHLAETALEAIIALAETEIARAHGTMAPNAYCVLAMGRLGLCEMTMASDLDLVFLYKSNAAKTHSSGDRPLHTTSYYIRLMQKVITLLTTWTNEGVLYDVDMRLRPSGNKGPVAADIEHFRTYQASEAQVWEKMALTKSRAIIGDPALIADFAYMKSDGLSHGLSQEALLKEILAMRALVHAQKKSQDALDIKNGEGGLTDIEFLHQFYLLCQDGGQRTGKSGLRPFLEGVFSNARVSLNHEEFMAAWRLYEDVLQLSRILAKKNQGTASFHEMQRLFLARGLNFESFAELENAVVDARARIHALYVGLMQTL